MDFLNGSIRLGRWFDVEVRVHILFLLWAGWKLVTAGGDWKAEAFFTGMLFAIVLCHEYGHCFGARSVGGDAQHILMWPLGGLAYAHAPMTPWAQFVTVACGPLVNVAFCLASGAALVWAAGTLEVLSLNPAIGARGWFGQPTWTYYARVFYNINYFLLCFNLLPVFPFDGGQLFRTLIWPFVGLQRATVLSAQMGIIGAMGLAAWGLSSGLAGGGMLIAIAIFGGMTSFQHLQAAKAGHLFDERIGRYEHVGRYRRKRGFWSWLKRRRPGESGADDALNPNPGGWQNKLDDEQRLEVEVDRILKKVHQKGVQSLSYVERQTLERATRARQERERELERRL